MHKALLPLAAAIALAPAFEAKAFDVPGVDYFCYWVNTSGRVVDLSSMCGASGPAALPPAALAPQAVESAEAGEVATQTDFLGSMRGAGYNLASGNNSTSDPTVSYDVWNHRTGQDHLYFIWGSSPGQGLDNRGEPEVVVQFFPPSKTARIDNAVAQACYLSFGSTCSTATLPASTTLPLHRRFESYSGNCLFPWQSARDGSQCGARAAIVRPGGF